MTGRFLTRDMFNGALSDMGLASDPFTNNRYAFGAGNPISAIELDGHLFGLSLSDVGHLALDVAGMVPVIGAPADLANAAWYTVEGDYLDASLSLAAAMPVLGDAALASKYAVKGGKTLIKGADEFLGGAKALDHGLSATTTALHAINGGQDLVAGGKTVEHAAASSSGATRQAAAAQAQAAQVARAQAAAARAEAAATSQAQDIAGKVARSCLNSFPGATRVLLGNGTTAPIDQVQVGDWVEATDPDTGQTVAEPVTAVIITPTDRDFTDTTIRTPDGTTSAITSTQHHRFYDVTRHAWIDAANLHRGDLLREPDGTWVTVVSVRNYHTHTTTYNLTVQTLHTYYILAGNTAILVHNCGTQISYGEGLSEKAIQHRLENPQIKSTQNVAVVRLRSGEVVAQESLGRSFHAEKLLKDRFDPADIVELYTERVPCAVCENIVRSSAWSHVRVTYSFLGRDASDAIATALGDTLF